MPTYVNYKNDFWHNFLSDLDEPSIGKCACCGDPIYEDCSYYEIDGELVLWEHLHEYADKNWRYVK